MRQAPEAREEVFVCAVPTGSDLERLIRRLCQVPRAPSRAAATLHTVHDAYAPKHVSDWTRRTPGPLLPPVLSCRRRSIRRDTQFGRIRSYADITP